MRDLPRYVVVALGIAALGVVVATVSFIALWERYHGDCLNWNLNRQSPFDANQPLFLFVAALVFFTGFMMVFVAAVWVLVRLANRETSSARCWITSLTTGLLIWSLVSFLVWVMNPPPGLYPPGGVWSFESFERNYLSILWPIGILQETGNYSWVFCGE